MAMTELTAQPRTIKGKEVKKLRREGIIPAVLYGPGVKGVQAISLPAREIERAYTQLGKSALLSLKIEGGRTQPVFIHQVQHDHTHRYLTHIDFFAPNMRIALTVTVQVVLTGEAPAIRLEDGVLVQSATELQVAALPDNIPAVLAVDVSGLTEIHSQIMAGDVELPEGVTLISAPDEVVVTVSQVQLVEVEDETEETEGEEGAEGAEGGEGAEGEDGAEGGADSEDDSSKN
jgi:large subunit ribosomal protein L25